MVFLPVGKAHQRLIREQKAVQPHYGLFPPEWEGVNTDISNAIVKPIRLGLAKKIVEEYEWLGCMPAVSLYHFGIFFDNVCAGVTVFSRDYIENLGRWDKYGFTGRMLLLSRGVCVHWAHPHAGSKLIMDSIRQLPKQYDVITATVDFAAGEIGTIYQACNFIYVGSMRESNPNIYEPRQGTAYRFGVKLDGKLYGPRAIRNKVGTQKKRDILDSFPNAEFAPQHNKHRYFLFRGSRANKKNLRRTIHHLEKPYPKRAVGAGHEPVHD